MTEIAPASRIVYAPHRPPIWMTLWFALSSLVVLWDVTYVLFRPRSMLGGDLAHFWKPYVLYAQVDTYVYGWPGYESGNGFPTAQSLMNVVETAANFLYLWLAHVTRSPVSVLVAFMAVTATCAKTVLYFLIECAQQFRGVRHNTWSRLIFLYIIPNGIWIVVPGILMVILGREVANALRVAARASATPVRKKTR